MDKGHIMKNTSVLHILFYILIVATPVTSWALFFTVTNTNDSGAGSLRQAIEDATTDDDTIEFDLSLEGQTIFLTSGELVIGDRSSSPFSGALTIKGLGADNLVISGSNSSAVFDINTEMQVFIIGLKIIDTTPFAITMNDSFDNTELTLTDCVITKNATLTAAISITGSLTVDNCIIHQNEGGAISLAPRDRYSLVVTNSTLSDNSGSGIVVGSSSTNDDESPGAVIIVTNSTISNNSGEGIFSLDSDLTVINSTISGNRAGAIVNDNSTAEIVGSTLANSENGSGILHTGSFISEFSGSGSTPLTVTNTTISGNASDAGGGIHIESFQFQNEFEPPATIKATLTNTTITGNSVTEQGGGVLIVPSQGDDITSITVNNSIIAGNNGPTNPDVAGNFISNGFNLIGVPGDSTGFEADIIEPDITNILDSILKNNGGSTQTHNLLPDSVAIDTAGSECPPPTTDQRGVQRPQGVACDIGAVEFQEADGSIDVSMCEIRTEYEPGGCKGKFNAFSLDDLEEYKASNFGKEGRGNYRNLVIKADIGELGDILDIESPCKIFVGNGVNLAGDFVSLDGRKGVRTNTIDINAEGSACLLSETEDAKLKSHSSVTAEHLVLQANKIAKLGKNTQVNVSDSLTVQSTGSTLKSRAIIDKGANLQVGTEMKFSSGFRAVIQNNAVVDVTGNLEMNAKTLNDCAVKNSTEISFGSKSGICAAKLP